jgi:hypothetical protein
MMPLQMIKLAEAPRPAVELRRASQMAISGDRMTEVIGELLLEAEVKVQDGGLHTPPPPSAGKGDDANDHPIPLHVVTPPAESESAETFKLSYLPAQSPSPLKSASSKNEKYVHNSRSVRVQGARHVVNS